MATKIWKDSFAPTSLGTGVALTTLNGGAQYPVPQGAGALLQVVSDVGETGAFTAAESLMIRSLITSDSLPSIVPKEWVQSFGMGGLSTFQYVGAPVLKATPIQVRLEFSTSNITFSGQAQIANTVAPEMTMELTFSNGGPTDTEFFYDAPDNETNTGTAAGQVAGNQLTINGGQYICNLYGVLTSGVVTASESYLARGQLASANYLGVPSPQTWKLQTVATGLNTPISVGGMGDRWTDVQLPIGQSFLADTGIQLDEALTATGNFIIGTAFKKTPMP